MITQTISWQICAHRFLRKNKTCVCGRPAEEVDHKIPVSLGGTGDFANLRALCRDCHLSETRRLRRMKTSFIAKETPDPAPEPKQWELSL